VSASDRLGASGAATRDFADRETATTQAAGHIARAAIYDVADGSQLAWMDRARCAEVGDDFWFPEKGGSTREPKRVCQSCEVRAECLEYALDHDERFGIWGGMSERERRRLKNRPPKQRNPETPPSPHRGVTWSHHLGKWRGRPYIGGRRVDVGAFTDPEEAGRAVDEAEAAYQAEHGEAA